MLKFYENFLISFKRIVLIEFSIVNLKVKLVFPKRSTTDSSINNRVFVSFAGLECILGIIRALRMGSCFSVESRSPIPNSPTPTLGIKKKKNSKKRPPGLRSSSFDHRREEQLHRVAGRMCLNGSSQVASLFTQQGKKGTNQDAMIVWEVWFSFPL